MPVLGGLGIADLLGGLFGGAAAAAPEAAAAGAAEFGPLGLPLITVTPEVAGGAAEGIGAGAGGLFGSAAGVGDLGAAAALDPLAALGAGLGGGFAGLAGLGGLAGGAGGAGAGTLGGYPIVGTGPQGQGIVNVPGVGLESWNPVSGFQGFQGQVTDLTAGAGGAANLGAPVAGTSVPTAQPLGAGLGPAALAAPPPPPPSPSAVAGVGSPTGGGVGSAESFGGLSDQISQDVADISGVGHGAITPGALSNTTTGAVDLGQMTGAPGAPIASNPENAVADNLLAGTPAPTSPSGFPINQTANDPVNFFNTGAAPNAVAYATGANSALGSLGDTAAPALGTTAPASGGGLGSLFGGGNLNTALEAGGLGLGALALLQGLKKSQQQPPYSPQLQGLANVAGNQFGELSGEGQQFLEPSLTGQLPPQLEQQVQNALNDAINTTKAKYASLGLGNSTMAADQIAYLQNQAEAMRGTLAQQLATTGTQLLSQATADLTLEGNIYNGLMQSQISQDNALESSVAQFAGSLALAGAIGSRGTTTTKAA